MNHQTMLTAAMTGIVFATTLWLLTQHAAYAAPKLSSYDDWRVRVVRAVLLGEARSEGPTGVSAVAEVIRNRMERHGTSAITVVTAHHQFSCLDHCSPESIVIFSETVWVVPAPTWHEATALAWALVFDPFNEKRIPDATKGATHYHAKGASPAWADKRKRTVTIGSHIFYRL